MPNKKKKNQRHHVHHQQQPSPTLNDGNVNDLQKQEQEQSGFFSSISSMGNNLFMQSNTSPTSPSSQTNATDTTATSSLSSNSKHQLEYEEQISSLKQQLMTLQNSFQSQQKAHDSKYQSLQRTLEQSKQQNKSSQTFCETLQSTLQNLQTKHMTLTTQFRCEESKSIALEESMKEMTKKHDTDNEAFQHFLRKEVSEKKEALRSKEEANQKARQAKLEMQKIASQSEESELKVQELTQNKIDSLILWEKEKTELMVSIQSTKEESKFKENACHSKSSKDQERIQVLETELNSAREQLDLSKKKYQVITEEKDQLLQDLDGMRTVTPNKIEEEEDEIENNSLLLATQNNYQNLQQQFQKTQSDLELEQSKYQEEIDKFQTQTNSQEEMIHHLQSKISILKESLEEKDSLHKEVSDELLKVLQRNEEMKLSESDSDLKNNPTDECNTKFEDQRKGLLSQLEKKMTTLENHAQKLESENIRLKNQLTKLQTNSSKNEDLKYEFLLKNMKREHRRLENLLERKECDYMELSKKVASLENVIDKISKSPPSSIAQEKSSSEQETKQQANKNDSSKLETISKKQYQKMQIKYDKMKNQMHTLKDRMKKEAELKEGAYRAMIFSHIF